MIVCYVLRKKNYSGVKGIVFFSLLKLILYAILEKIDWVNQKSVLFFSATERKTQIWNRMNEWHVNFYRKQKNKKTGENPKKHTPVTYIE